jgi:uncharacterized protein (TIGR03435 family)
MNAVTIKDRLSPITTAKRAGTVLVSLCLTFLQTSLSAQSAPVSPVTTTAYDAVSIKLNKSGSGSSGINSNLYRFSATNVSLKSLLEQAYGIRPDLISGVDGPAAAAHFDIEAKVVEPDPAAMKDPPPGQYRVLVLRMLREYFHLEAHTESKIAAVYNLELAKDGPKFKQSATLDPKDAGTSIHNQEMEAKNITMASLAATLTNQVQRTVIDKTGLTATYDLKLKWSRDNGAALDDGTKDGPPLIYTALKEQLGLKLEPAKGPVETLAVDHVEMPSEN